MSAGKSLGVGVLGSLGILAFGIPALWPLGLIAAGVTHAIVNNRRNEKKVSLDDEQADEDTTESADNEHIFTLPELTVPLHTRRHNYEINVNRLGALADQTEDDEPAWLRHLERPLHFTPTLNGLDEQDEVEQEPVHHSDPNEPSLRNERYFQRHRNG